MSSEWPLEIKLLIFFIIISPNSATHILRSEQLNSGWPVYMYIQFVIIIIVIVVVIVIVVIIQGISRGELSMKLWASEQIKG